MQYAITKGNRVVATAENKEESIALLGLLTHAVKREIVHRKKKYACSVCGKKYKSVIGHMTRAHKEQRGLIQQALGR